MNTISLWRVRLLLQPGNRGIAAVASLLGGWFANRPTR
jgi:hypothetical protein